MSSSISLTSSGDLDCLTSKSNSGDEFKCEQYFAGLEAELKRARSATRKIGSNQNVRIRYNNLFSQNSGPLFSGRQGRDEIYDEIDDRMSRNSLDYQQRQQAKYVELNKWLDEQQNALTSNNLANQQLGNVIGIKGYGSSKNLRSDCDESMEFRKQQANYNKLKFNFIKLESDYERIQGKLIDTIDKFKKIFKLKENDIYVLRRALKDKQRKSTRCNCKNSNLIEELKKELFILKTELKRKEDPMIKSDNISKNSENIIEEVKTLRNQVKNLSLEPNNRLMNDLKRKNSKLKDLTELDALEFKNLKFNYLQLNNQVENLLVEQKKLENDKNEQVSRLLMEICKYQVQLPKLEMLLKTEREIKSELQRKLLKLDEEKDNLQDKLSRCKKELINEKSGLDHKQSSELNKMIEEVKCWQEKYHKLKREMGDSEELIRSIKSRLTSADNQRAFERNQLIEMHKKEVGKLQDKIRQMEERESTNSIKLNKLNESLKECESLRQKCLLDLEATTKRLELVDRNEDDREKIENYEKQLVEMRKKLNKFEFENRDLKFEIKTQRSLNDRQNQQLQDTQQRFKVQQKAFEELRDKRDQEVTKLRTELNFEKYNRQMALKGMERQLRISLRELNNVKSTFIQNKQINQSSKFKETTKPTSECSINSIDMTQVVKTPT